jgi:hypothetical protein
MLTLRIIGPDLQNMLIEHCDNFVVHLSALVHPQGVSVIPFMDQF